MFGLVGLLIISPLFFFNSMRRVWSVRQAVLGASTEAYGYLQVAKNEASAFDFNSADQAFQKASDAFTEAQSKLNEVNGVILAIAKLIPFAGRSIVSGEALIAAGQEIALAGQSFSRAVESLTEQTGTSNEANVSTVGLALSALQNDLGAVGQHITTASEQLDRVRLSDVPRDKRDTVRAAKDALPKIVAGYQSVETAAQAILALFGSTEERQYLVVFQNSNELRPTGGFMGSLALVAARDGRIRIVEVPGRGFLDINSTLMKKIQAPAPLTLVNPLWQAQDANWWPDWPTSAAKIGWFYEQARGYPIDGVIAVTPRLVEKLIQLTGPIELNEFKLIVTNDNLTATLQEAVETNYDRSLNQPKQVIGSLIGRLVERLFELPGHRLVEVGAVLTDAVQRRDLMIAPFDPAVAEPVNSLGWSGQLLDAPRDYLMVVDTNIGGGKTDGVVSESVDHSVSLDSAGQPTVELTITREHHGDPNDIWTKTSNVDYLRIYSPANSEFISADGFSTIGPNLFQSPSAEAVPDDDLERIDGTGLIDERSQTRISQSLGKTVFANWLEVHVGEKITARIKYRLPFTLASGSDQDYSLLVQAQPGAQNRYLTSRLNFPDRFEPVWLSPADGALVRIGQSLQSAGPLERDRSYGVIFRIKNEK